MGTPRSLAGYPEWFFALTEKLVSTPAEKLRVGSKGDAWTIRRKYYAWRKILDEQGHPSAAAAQGVMVQAGEDEQGWYLNFTMMGGISAEDIARLGGNKAEEFKEALAPANLEQIIKQKKPDEDVYAKYFNPVLGKDDSSRLETSSEEILEPEELSRMLAESPEEEAYRVRIESCEHSWDTFGSCTKCQVSKIAWERKEYKL